MKYEIIRAGKLFFCSYNKKLSFFYTNNIACIFKVWIFDLDSLASAENPFSSAWRADFHAAFNVVITAWHYITVRASSESIFRPEGIRCPCFVFDRHKKNPIYFNLIIGACFCSAFQFSTKVACLQFGCPLLLIYFTNDNLIHYSIQEPYINKTGFWYLNGYLKMCWIVPFLLL